MHDRKKLIEVFADNYELLAKQAIGMTGNRNDALDVLQNVALSILSRDDQTQEIMAPLAYFRTCIRNDAINNRQTTRRAIPTNPDTLSEIQSSDCSNASRAYVELMDWLETQLSFYSPELRRAFIMHYIENYPLDTIAQELSMTPNALAQQFKRMRGKVAMQAQSLMMLLLILSYLLSSSIKR